MEGYWINEKPVYLEATSRLSDWIGFSTTSVRKRILDWEISKLRFIGFPNKEPNLPRFGIVCDGNLYAINRHRLGEPSPMRFPTPRVSDAKDAGPCEFKRHSLGLNSMAKYQKWPTPTVDDANNITRKSGQFQSLARSVYNLHGGMLNPNWVELLMGFPPSWSKADPLALRLTRKEGKCKE